MKTKYPRGKHPNTLKNLKSVKPGEASRNPAGPWGADPALQKLKRITSDEVRDIMTLVMRDDRTALQRIMADKSAPVIRVWLASIALTGIRMGDTGRLESLFARVLGKVPDRIADADGKALSPAQVVIRLPSNGRESETT